MNEIMNEIYHPFYRPIIYVYLLYSAPPFQEANFPLT